jgi:hypothetical protein
MALYMGDPKGITPMLAMIKASAIVAKGADKAFPITVRRSREIPNALRRRMPVRQNEGSLCSTACMEEKAGKPSLREVVGLGERPACLVRVRAFVVRRLCRDPRLRGRVDEEKPIPATCFVLSIKSFEHLGTLLFPKLSLVKLWT